MTEMNADVDLVVGLMSGTSMDGVDAALIETDGEGHLKAIASHMRPYGEEEQSLLRQALADADGLDDRTARPGCLAEAEALVTRAHVEAVSALLALEAAKGKVPKLVGFHGQTVWHDPAKGVTVQIGDGQGLADALGLPVVHDFRAADMAAGGQGAPLAPVYHRALQQADDLPLPLAVINIGGVANITWIDAKGGLTAFDSGPGNALINDWVAQHTGQTMDEGGRIAAAGQVDFMALVQMMANPFFRLPAPKSLDRNAFDVTPVANLSLEDGAATLAAFTVETLCLGLEQMEQAGPRAAMAVVCGGGQHNAHLMAMLADALDMPVKRANDLGWRGDALEAEAFAYMAVRSQKGLPLTFPGTTGTKEPVTGGLLARPA